ncbi:MAG: tRNA lysidine(34) synthetase TilS [Clostridia bacterium]|nr:tRNA lysidine(34) synthetase TilS [Clostridia bacterium]
MKNLKKISYTPPHLLSNLPQNTPVLLAFSGGADSSALLHLLKEDAQTNHFKLHAAHFNHQIRGEEAERDAIFCKQICEKLDIPFYLGTADIPALAKENGNSVEAEARVQRYAFFEKIMREHNIPILVTAHHAEDQVETILLHILRGSGISGICGMQECRPFANDLYLVRPLLKAQKQDVLALCEQNKIDFVVDSTNEDTQYTRNALRHEIIPRLYELQPNLCGAFDRLSKSARDADDFINASALEFIKNECDENIPLTHFNKLFDAQKSKVLSILFEEKYGATLERVHINAIIELCQKVIPHSSVSLPHKTCAKIENNNLVFEKEATKNDDVAFDPIPFGEGNIDTKCGVTIKIEKNPTQKLTKNPLSLDVKCELLDQTAHFRARNEGDVIFVGKMNKKAKKLISEKKIPLDVRNVLPILVSKNEILWIPSVAVCDRIKTDKIKSGDNFFRITIKFEN